MSIIYARVIFIIIINVIINDIKPTGRHASSLPRVVKASAVICTVGQRSTAFSQTVVEKENKKLINIFYQIQSDFWVRVVVFMLQKQANTDFSCTLKGFCVMLT